MIVTAGILFYEERMGGLRVWLVHPSSVVHDNSKAKWSIPKGEMDLTDAERFSHCAVRETQEEVGITVTEDALRYLGCSLYKHRQKTIHAFCHPFIGVGKKLSWEVDAFSAFTIEEAKQVVHEAQVVFINRLQKYLIQRKAVTI